MISKSVIRKYCQLTGRQHAQVRCTKPDKPIVIGYQTLPTVAPRLTVFQLQQNPVIVMARLMADSQTPGLYWIAVRQRAGAVAYRWSAPNGQVQYALVYANGDPGTASARKNTSIWSRRRKLVWRLMYMSGMAEAIITRMCKAADYRLQIITDAVVLAHWAVQKQGGTEGARQYLLGLKEQPLSSQNLQQDLAAAGVITKTPRALTAVLRCAALAFTPIAPPRQPRTRRRLS